MVAEYSQTFSKHLPNNFAFLARPHRLIVLTWRGERKKIAAPKQLAINRSRFVFVQVKVTVGSGRQICQQVPGIQKLYAIYLGRSLAFKPLLNSIKIVEN